MDGSEDLRKLYSKFIQYYEKHEHAFCDQDLVGDCDVAGPSTRFT